MKSLIRERRNRLLKAVAIGYALAVPAFLGLAVQPLLAVAYLPAAIRTLAIPQNHNFKAIVLGVVEIVCSVWFAVWTIVWWA